MAISDTQKVDYLWKKIGYSATKTDTTANKDATNEALPSPLQIRGDNLLVQSSSIPGSIPATTTSIVSVYRPDATLEMPQTPIGTNGLGQRGQLGSATAYRTWQTGLQNWISPEFGATYAVRVFLDTAGRTTSNTTGTELFATATNEEWFFDYQSGVLNFSGTNLPSGISTKSVYISGARYTGEIGIANTVNTAVAAFAHANAAFAAANTGASSAAAFNQANSAFFHANAAFTAANNATDTYVRNHANAAFDAANAATATNTTQNNSIASAFVHANAAFANANSYITYNEAVSVTQNNSIASAFVHANAAFTAANNATDTFVRNHANAAFDTANGAVAVNTTQNNSITVALDTANAAFSNANSYITYNEAVSVTQNNSITAAFAAANAATATDVTQNNSIASSFVHANAAFTRANNSLNANTGGTITGDVIVIGNVSANIVSTTGSNGIISGANAIFANYVYAANGNVDLYIYATKAFDVANAASSGSATDSFARNQANASFTAANGAVAVNLTQNNSITVALNTANAVFENSNAFIVLSQAVNLSQNSSIASAFDTANAAFASANLINGVNTTQNNSITVALDTANAAFAAANASTATDTTQNNSITVALNTANAAFASANNIDGVNTTQNNSIAAAFAAANAATATDVTQNNSIAASFVHANAAFTAANAATATDTTQNNSITAAFIHANSAYATANVKTETFVQASEPAGANVDDIWIDSTSGIQYVYINSNSSNQWVEFSAYGTPLNGTANVQFADQTISPVYPARPLVLSTGGDLHLNASANVVTFNVVPSNPTISLGSSDRPFKNVWISNASIHLQGNELPGGAQPVRITNDANNVVIESGGLKIRGGALTANSFLDISHLYALNVESSFIVSNATFSSTNALVKIVGSNTGFAQPPVNPGYMLHITGKQNTASRIINDSFGADANTYPIIAGRAARGTADAPTAVKAGDILARYSGNGHDGTSYAAFGTGRIDIIATQDHTTLNKGTSIILSTMANNTNVLSNIANFDGNSSVVYGTFTATKGYIQLPRTANNGADSVAVTIDFANDSIVRATINSNMTVNFINYISGKSIQLWVYNRDTGGGSTHTVTHGCAATNATNGATTKTIPGAGLAVFQYVSWSGDLANTQVVIHQG